MSTFVLGVKSMKHLESLLQSGKPASQILVDAVKDFIIYSPIDFCILDNGGYRTLDIQNELFKKGVSKCDGLINKSKHQLGLAVDLVPWVNGKATWGEKETFYLAGSFLAFCRLRNIEVTSGADWNMDGILLDGWDPCHMEIKE